MILTLDALYEFIVLIKDFVISILEGLYVLVQTLGFIVSGAGQGYMSWMPSAISAVMTVALILIIVLRVIGR